MLKNVFQLDEQRLLFQLRFLKYNNDQRFDVEVEEVEELNFREVKRHLKNGETVVIKPQRTQKRSTSLIAREEAAELWYFTHI